MQLAYSMTYTVTPVEQPTVSAIQRYVAIPLNPNNSHRVGQLAIPVPLHPRISIIEQSPAAHPICGCPWPVHANIYDFKPEQLAASLESQSGFEFKTAVRARGHRAIKDWTGLAESDATDLVLFTKSRSLLCNQA